MNIRWRQKERNAYSWEFPATSPLATVGVLLVRTRKIVERQAVQWVDGPKKIGGETQEALSELEEETQEAFSEHEQEQEQKEGEAGPASRSENL